MLRLHLVAWARSWGLSGTAVLLAFLFDRLRRPPNQRSHYHHLCVHLHRLLMDHPKCSKSPIPRMPVLLWPGAAWVHASCPGAYLTPLLGLQARSFRATAPSAGSPEHSHWLAWHQLAVRLSAYPLAPPVSPAKRLPLPPASSPALCPAGRYHFEILALGARSPQWLASGSSILGQSWAQSASSDCCTRASEGSRE